MSRWLKILLLGLAVAGVALFSLPWWLDAPLRPILRRWDITFERYERAGYAHFRLVGLRYANGSVEVTAGQVLGEVGNTGASYGTHLHLEIHVNGAPTDPIPFLRDRGVDVKLQVESVYAGMAAAAS